MLICFETDEASKCLQSLQVVQEYQLWKTLKAISLSCWGRSWCVHGLSQSKVDHFSSWTPLGDFHAINFPKCQVAIETTRLAPLSVLTQCEDLLDTVLRVDLLYYFIKQAHHGFFSWEAGNKCQVGNQTLEIFLNGAEFSLNSVNSPNSRNLIYHWSMNWAQFKDSISHMCPGLFNNFCFCPSIRLIQWKHLGKKL